VSDDAPSNQADAWFEEQDAKKRADAVWTNIERIERAQEDRHLNDLFHASLYGNVEIHGFSPRNYGARGARAHARLSLNVVRNMVSSVVSKIAAKNKVHPKFLTSGAEASVQRRARGLEKVVGGIFYDQRFYRTQRKVFRDMGIYGTGFVRPWVDEKTRMVTIERVRPTSILVDEQEAIDGNPRSLYHVRWYDKRVLAKLFPGNDEIIRNAGKRSSQRDTTRDDESDSTSDVVMTVESFHLPSEPGANDGIRTVSVDSGELGKAPWLYDYHPFPKIVWSDEPEGYFGAGLAYELAGIQAEINDILAEFARAHRLIKGGWIVEHNAKVILKHLNDDLGKIIRYSGVAPTYLQPVAIPQDTYRYLWDLYAKAFEIAGISQLSASGTKPAGLNSGEAQRVYLDEQSERFLDVGNNLEDFTLDVTEQCIDRARELAKDKEHGGFKVSAKTDEGLEVIDFTDVDLEKGSYLIQIFPTSFLPNTPSGRLAFINDLVELGVVQDEGEAMKLLGFPDLEAFMARKNAPRQLLESNIEKILEKGTWIAPEPLDDHELTMVELPLALAQARNKGTEPARLSLLRRYLVLSARLQKLKLSGAIAGAVVDGDPGADPNADPNAPPMPPDGGAPLPPDGGGEPMPLPMQEAA
jgi:hypothetical protein